VTFPTCCGLTPLARLYRAFLSTPTLEHELALFVEADSQAQAREAMTTYARTVLGPLAGEGGEVDLYHVQHATELLAGGVATDALLRLFERGWSGARVVAWIRQPVFLVRDPAALLTKWLQMPQEALYAR
jgi:hypothetical protein